jgi:hypothetical protein
MARDDAAKAPPMIPQRYEEYVELGRLTPHPANFNEGDVGLLCELIDANGFAGAVMAQESTGIIIDGGTRYDTAVAQGWAGLPVMWVDVDDATRDRLLAEWNETGRRGTNNLPKMVAFLEGLAATPEGLRGSAFDGDHLDKLILDLNRPLNLAPGHSPGADAPTGAQYAENDEQLAERQARIEGYQDRKQGGALVEMILVFTPEEHAEATGLLAGIRQRDGDLPAAAVVLAALRQLAPAPEPEPS